jgi:hypothetical protein
MTCSRVPASTLTRHVDQDHPEMQRTDEQFRQRVANNAYDTRS